MNLMKKIKGFSGIVTVEIQGFFTERFINLCKINNIKIWNIKNIVNGIVRFQIYISDFKKLRSIAKKTKCKVKIKNKKGIYFVAFRYRKRKSLLIVSILLLLLFILSTSFLWNIKFTGNTKLDNNYVYEKLNESGLYVGRSKIGLDVNEVLKKLRSSLPEYSWIGIEINGSHVDVEFKEKTTLNDKDKQDNRIGDIYAEKSGIIKKLIVENGSPKVKQGSYIQEGMMIIEGRIYSNYIEPKDVHAKGIITIDSEYVFEKKYDYNTILKEYTSKKRYNLGFSINSKEFYINYLNSNNKYDKIKYNKIFDFFGNKISFDWYVFKEYEEKEYKYLKDELIQAAEEDSNKYLDNIVGNLYYPNVIDEKVEITDSNDGIIYKKTFIINERIGNFVERNN